MQQFKVGDWIRNTEINRIFKYSYQDLQYDTANPQHSKHDEPWQPKEGEWCWFGQRLGKVLDVFTVQGKTKVKSTVEYPVYVMNGRRKELYETRNDWNIDNVEPFIGQLPSFIQDRT